MVWMLNFMFSNTKAGISLGTTLPANNTGDTNTIKFCSYNLSIWTEAVDALDCGHLSRDHHYSSVVAILAHVILTAARC